MKLKNAQETFEAAPKGRYKMKITAAEAKLSAKGSPMIALVVEIREGDHAGKQAFDYLITDESFKGAGMAKLKLRGLGIDVDTEQTDEAVCGQLLGREVYADLDVEQAQDKQQKLKWQINPATGQQIPLMNNRVLAYFTAPPTAATATPTTGAAAPAGATAPAGPRKAAFPGFPGAVPKAGAPAAAAAPAGATATAPAAPAAAAPEHAAPPFAGVQPPTKAAEEAPKA